MPSLKLFLAPSLAENKADHFVRVRMTLDISAVKKDEVLFHHTLARGPIKTMQYTPQDIKIRNSSVTIPIYAQDSQDKRQRKFFAGSDLLPGKLTVEYQAIPWDVMETSPCGPQIALERDGGGLTAAGMSFILRPATDENMHITVEWDLSSTPSGTRAACSLGEGQKVTAQAKASVLDECFFAVGPLNSYPPGETGGKFGIYWLENPPFDAVALARRMEALLPKLTAFFNDYDPTFRIFIRRNIQKCVSGRGLHRGFVFAWTTLAPRPEDEIEEFLMHETIHNWPRLGFSGSIPTPEELADGWFNEGIAEYYSLILPHRFGIISEEDFIRRLNIRISGYYTNPDRNVKNRDVQERFWKGGHVNRIPDQRGFMYFMKLAFQLRVADGRPLDNLILEMVDLRNRDQPHGIAVWLSMLEKELGPSALTDYHAMSEAVTMILPRNYLHVVGNLDRTLEREDQEEFCLGFSEDFVFTKPAIVKELDPTSRAAEAGVREGDFITPQYTYFFAAERLGEMFTMTVKHEAGDGMEEIKVLTWSPRSRDKVESYQFVAGEK